jgi:ribosomal-protein-alanine N-acetyltransferase
MNEFNRINFDSCYFLEGKITYLRPLLKSDIRREYLSWLNNPELTTYSSHFRTFPTTEKDLENFLERVKDSNSVVFALCCKKTGVHFGNASIDDIDWINRNAHFNSMIGLKKYRGMHFLDIMNVMTNYAFNTLNLNKLTGGSEIPNLEILHKRMGWQVEGVFKNHNYLNGKYIDVVRFAIFKDDYNRITNHIL